MKKSTTITSLFTTAYVCDDCKKFYTSTDNGHDGVYCPKCHSLLMSKRLMHRVLHTGRNRETLSELTELKAMSGTFNVELPLKENYEESLKLLSSEDLL